MTIFSFLPPSAQADKLLSMDFKNVLDDIISFLPQDRQILLFSATFPVTVKEFVVSVTTYNQWQSYAWIWTHDVQIGCHRIGWLPVQIGCIYRR